ncbi:MDR/zinc-dependent alcohol dehydrogenase-like family protein [Geodermatophilus marinus]|uniref:hypothetical protein n=1 Tax=Geodermatophilus sp. LHW52908 TaxID=2303986 RepID=UPI001F490B5D|nr:hypothetical protein [Geodermatophilus sp. LHW52908]
MRGMAYDRFGGVDVLSLREDLPDPPVGTVEAVGPAVVDVRAGDEVFGYVRRDDVQWGTAAELVPAPQRCVAPGRGPR